jgi:hypothetical protein
MFPCCDFANIFPRRALTEHAANAKRKTPGLTTPAFTLSAVQQEEVAKKMTVK